MTTKTLKRFARSVLTSLAAALALAGLRWAFNLGRTAAMPTSPQRGLIEALRPVDPPILPTTDFEGAVFILQVLVSATAVIILDPRKAPRWWSGPGLGASADAPDRTPQIKFLAAWRAVWLCWAILYAGLTLGWLAARFAPAAMAHDPFVRYGMWAFGDIMNTVAAYMFFDCLFRLDDTSGAPTAGTARPTLAGVALALLTLSLLDLHGAMPLLRYFGSYLLYTFNGLAMFFFFGRLASATPRPSYLAIAPLYIYASIQFPYSTFEVLSGSPVFYRPVFFLFTLCLKSFLFVFVARLLLSRMFQHTTPVVRDHTPTPAPHREPAAHD